MRYQREIKLINNQMWKKWWCKQKHTKNRLVRLQKLISLISLSEHAPKYKGEAGGNTTCKAQESCKETNLTFVFLTSAFISLSLIFSANSIFLSLYMKIIWDRVGRKWEAKGCSSVRAELGAGSGSLLGNVVFYCVVGSQVQKTWYHGHVQVLLPVQALVYMACAGANTIWPQHGVTPSVFRMDCVFIPCYTSLL